MFLFSCSSPSTISNWKNPDNKNVNIKKLLNFAIIKDLDDKRECEEKINMGFEYENIVSHSSTEYPELFSKPSLNSLSDVISENKFDYFLTVKYIERISDKADYANINYTEYFTKGLEKMNKPDYKEFLRDVDFEVILFSVKEKKPVWAGVIKTINDIEMEIEIDLIMKITSDLKKEGIIKK